MDQIQPVGTGQWVPMNLTGGLIQAFRHPHQDGIFDFNLKGYHMVHKKVVNCMGLQHQQTVKKVGAG